MEIPTVLAPGAIQPRFMSDGAAAADLYCMRGVEPIVVEPHTTRRIPTGVSMAIPVGYYGQIASRSGLAIHHTVFTVGGVIDADYTGKIDVVLYNGGTSPYTVQSNDRIAQLLILPCCKAQFDIVTDLPKTMRGSDGFGSSGK